MGSSCWGCLSRELLWLQRWPAAMSVGSPSKCECSLPYSTGWATRMGGKEGVCSGYHIPGVSFKSNMNLNLLLFTCEVLFWWIIKVIFVLAAFLFIFLLQYLNVLVDFRFKKAYGVNLMQIVTVLLYWLCQSLWLWITAICGKFLKRWEYQTTLLPPEKTVCRLRSNT